MYFVPEVIFKLHTEKTNKYKNIKIQKHSTPWQVNVLKICLVFFSKRDSSFNCRILLD